jgi:CBS domain-containing membrane protein
MNREDKKRNFDTCTPFNISDDDIIKAMKDIKGYLDITPGDFKILYRLAYTHAVERISHMFKASDVMTKNVFSVNKSTPIEKAAQLMADQGISGVPVVGNEGEVIGIISETDILSQMGSKNTGSLMDVITHCLESKSCVALSIFKKKAEEVMTSPAITVRAETPVTEIASVMAKDGINRVPVTDGKGKLIGIVSRADIVQVSCALATKTRD